MKNKPTGLVKFVLKGRKKSWFCGFVVPELAVGSGGQDTCTQISDFRILGNDGAGWFCLFLHGGFQF